MDSEVLRLQHELKASEAHRNELVRILSLQSSTDQSPNAPFIDTQNFHYGQTYPLLRSKSSSDTGSIMPVMNKMSGRQAFNRQQRSKSHHSSVRGHHLSSQVKSDVPFRPTGPIASLSEVAMKRSASSQSAFPSRSFPSPSAQALPRIQENDALVGVGVDPADWIAANPYDDSCAAFWTNYPSHSDIPLTSASNCPSLYAGQSVREQASPITPQTSSFGYHTHVDPHWSYNNTEMANASLSQQSLNSHQLSQDMLASDQDAFPHGVGDIGIDLFACGAGAELQGFEAHGELTCNMDNSLTIPSEAACMARSGSNMSTASSGSTASSLRLKERREQVLENARRTILAPKPQATCQVNTSSSAKPFKKGKPVSRKPSSNRRKHARVVCSHCQEHPGGFRGLHELQRHMASKHAPAVNKWLCRDPATVGLETIRPKIPLEGCKNCESGKHYGAYYNAAAHLRRAHFKPKEDRTSKKGLGKEEKRGGSAGGDWPPMDVLKMWLEEVVVLGQPAKAEELSTPNDVGNEVDEDDEMDDADDAIVADVSDGIDARIKLDPSPVMLDATCPPIIDEVMPEQMSATPVLPLSDTSYLSTMDVTSISNHSQLLQFSHELGQPPSMDPTFSSVSPSDWNPMSSDTYIATTYGYSNEGNLSEIL